MGGLSGVAGLRGDESGCDAGFRQRVAVGGGLDAFSATHRFDIGDAADTVESMDFGRRETVYGGGGRGCRTRFDFRGDYQAVRHPVRTGGRGSFRADRGDESGDSAGRSSARRESGLDLCRRNRSLLNRQDCQWKCASISRATPTECFVRILSLISKWDPPA